MGKSKFSYSFQEVCPGVFLGPEYSLAFPKVLSMKNITHLLSLNNYTTQHPGVILKTIDIEDEESENIAQYFEECIRFIKDSHRVLVFCAAGRSRSATVLCAYLMKTKCFDLDEALQFISRVREINPNKGFIQQLKAWKEQTETTFLRSFGDCLKIHQWHLTKCRECNGPILVYSGDQVQGEQKRRAEQEFLNLAKQTFGTNNWRVKRFNSDGLSYLHAKLALRNYKL